MIENVCLKVLLFSENIETINLLVSHNDNSYWPNWLSIAPFPLTPIDNVSVPIHLSHLEQRYEMFPSFKHINYS